LVLWIIDGNLKVKLRILLNSKVILFFILFILYNLVSLLWTYNLNSAYEYIIKYKYYIPILIIFTTIKQEYIKYTIIAFLSSMFVSEIITYGIYFDFWTTQYYQLKGSLSPTAFMSHTIYSAILAFVSVMTLNKVILSNNNITRFIMIIFYISISLNLLISGGRTGLVPFLFVHIISFIFLYKLKLKYIISGIVIISAMFFIGYNNINSFKNRIDQGYSDINQMIDKNNYKTPVGTRYAMIYVGLNITYDNLLFGVGIKDNMDEMITYANSIKKFDFRHLKLYYKWHFHNQYIDILTQLGIIGLILFMGIFYTLFRLPIKDKEISNIKFLFVFTFLFSIISSDLFHQMHYMHMVGLLIGLLLAQNKFENLENLKC
ncbi:MAG: O-antigen ligase family protein, partial [Arcobacteraceae bacterium]|nr:O-antigen ligase family protein [Arcobacteraceae bacterium]